MRAVVFGWLQTSSMSQINTFGKNARHSKLDIFLPCVVDIQEDEMLPFDSVNQEVVFGKEELSESGLFG